jgi:hypothetical protein
VDIELQRIKRKIFEEYRVDTVTVDKDYKKETLEKLVCCYQVVEDEEVEDNSCDIHILEGEGERRLEGTQLQSK